MITDQHGHSSCNLSRDILGLYYQKSKIQPSTMTTPVLFMTSTSTNMNLVKKVYGGVKNRIIPTRGCSLCIPVTQLTKEMGNRV